MDIPRRRFFARPPPGCASFRPPWSLSEAQFAERCSRCDDCMQACPTGLLVRGDGGFPVANFALAACTFCGDCAQACKTGAIVRSEEQIPWQFGIRISETCLPMHSAECRVCGEACDTGAIRFRPRPGGVALPEIDNAVCTGCGGCIAPCPVSAIERIALSAVAATSPLVEEFS